MKTQLQTEETVDHYNEKVNINLQRQVFSNPFKLYVKGSLIRWPLTFQKPSRAVGSGPSLSFQS